MDAASATGLDRGMPPAIALSFLDALGLCQDQPAGRAERRAARLSDALQSDQASYVTQELVATLQRLDILSDEDGDEDEDQRTASGNSQCDPPAVETDGAQRLLRCLNCWS